MENLRVLEGSEVFFRGLQHPDSPVQIRVAPLRKPWKDEFPGLIFPIKMYLLKTVKTDFWKIGQHQEFFSVSRIRLRL